MWDRCLPDALVSEVGNEGRGDGGGEPEHGGGSLRVTDSTQAAEEEHARCEGAASLLCFRAANVVVILEDDVHPAGLARLTDALRAMESG